MSNANNILSRVRFYEQRIQEAPGSKLYRAELSKLKSSREYLEWYVARSFGALAMKCACLFSAENIEKLSGEDPYAVEDLRKKLVAIGEEMLELHDHEFASLSVHADKAIEARELHRALEWMAK